MSDAEPEVIVTRHGAVAVVALNAPAGGADHAELLATETEAQIWSLRQPRFLEGLREIQARIARGR